VTLYGYDEFFHINAENPVFLRTATNSFVSLYLNLEASSGGFSRVRQSEAYVHHQKIISSQAVIGPDCWRESDCLKAVTFVVPHADTMFRHRVKLDTVSEERRFDWEAAQLFSVRVGSATYRARYLATYSIASTHAEKV
jgi:hypothetical protein